MEFKDWLFGFGWIAGSLAMWMCFKINKLIRTREEWYVATNHWTENWLSEEDGQWYFYDPGNERYGPYPTKEHARKALMSFKYETQSKGKVFISSSW